MISKTNKNDLFMQRPLPICLVQQVGKSLHLIKDEMIRWRKILEEAYQEYLLSK
jgi:hypothetical protein